MREQNWNLQTCENRPNGVKLLSTSDKTIRNTLACLPNWPMRLQWQILLTKESCDINICIFANFFYRATDLYQTYTFQSQSSEELCEAMHPPSPQILKVRISSAVCLCCRALMAVQAHTHIQHFKSIPRGLEGICMEDHLEINGLQKQRNLMCSTELLTGTSPLSRG